MTPDKKVSAGALAGAFSILIVWLMNAGFGVDVPGEAASAITTILTFAVSYMVPNE